MPDSLHAIRSLICTSTRETPHERMFRFDRRSTSGPGVPKWLTEAEGSEIWVRNFRRAAKSEPRVKPANLIEAFPPYARVEFPDSRVDTVSLDDVAPKGKYPKDSEESEIVVPQSPESEEVIVENVEEVPVLESVESSSGSLEQSGEEVEARSHEEQMSSEPELRRSNQELIRPARFADYVQW